MTEVLSLTEAKTNFSRIIERVVNQGEKFIITWKGKKAAIILPFEDFEQLTDDELLTANPILTQTESAAGEIVDSLYGCDRVEMKKMQRREIPVG